MILPDDIVDAGRINRPHGIKGELSVTLHPDTPEPEEDQCVVVDVDGIPTPFFIASARQRGPQAWLIRLDGVDDERHARPFALKTLYYLAEDVPEDEEFDPDDPNAQVYLDDLIGYTIIDDEGYEVGRIDDYDDSTPNLLFIVSAPDINGHLLIPAADDLITDIDHENKLVEMIIPEGLL